MKLLDKVSNVLNITFKGNYATRAGVTFRRGNNANIMVGSVIYNNVYGIITDKVSDTDMKNIANNIANIATIGKLISEEMKSTQVKPYGRWFVTSSTVRTQVKVATKGKYEIYNAIYSKSTGKQIGKLQRLEPSEIKTASVPVLRNKTVKSKDSSKNNKNKTELSMEGFEMKEFEMKEIKYNSNNDFEFEKGYDKAIEIIKSNMPDSEKKEVLEKAKRALEESGGYLAADPNNYVIGFNLAVERFSKKEVK